MASNTYIREDEWNIIKDYTNKYPVKKILAATKRSEASVNLIKRTDNYTMYRRIVRAYTRPGETRTYSELINEYRHLVRSHPVKTVQTVDTLESAIADMDKAIDTLKDSIETVIMKAVEIRTKQEIEKKDQEKQKLQKDLEEAREVVEAAKRGNWAESIKRSLIGG